MKKIYGEIELEKNVHYYDMRDKIAQEASPEGIRMTALIEGKDITDYLPERLY